VRKKVPNARLNIHTETTGADQGTIWNLVKKIAEETPGSRGVHNIHIQQIDKKTVVDIHLEVDASMTVKQAHTTATLVEKQIKGTNPTVAEVNVHIETASDRVSREMKGTESDLDEFIRGAAQNYPEIRNIGKVIIRNVGEALHLIVHAHFDPDLNIEKAHIISSKLENLIRTNYSNVTRVDIHEEPVP